MDRSLAPGTLCVRHGEPEAQFLIVDEHPGQVRAVRYPVDDIAPIALSSGDLEAVGQDAAAARVLSLRWGSSAHAAAFGAGTPLRTAMVLCAGLGTRLRPMTLHLPKPAVPFFDGPLIRYGFALLKGVGIERVVINTHHRPALMEQAASSEAARLGLDLLVSHERVIQGTGGGVRDARRLLGDEPFLLLNGDAFMSLDLAALIAAHQARHDAATLAVVPMPRGAPYAAVEATPDGDVKRIAGIGLETPCLTPWHFVGAHVIEPSVFDFVAKAGEQDINRAIYPAMVRAGLPVRVCPVAVGAWGDLGTPHRYLQACEEILTGLCDLRALGAWAPADFCPMTQFVPADRRHWVHPTAEVSGTLAGWAVVGPSCRVEGRVTRAAILPGTHIEPGEHVEDVIALGDMRLERGIHCL